MTVTDSSKLPLVVAVSGDPGGANALAPVIEFLRTRGQARVEARAYRQAREVWRKRGMSFAELDEQAAVALPDSTELVLTSTSLNGMNLEKQFTAAAHRRGIPAVALLDFWSNYRQRFGIEEEDRANLPDRIAVMDAQAREEMIAEGFGAERVVVTGQPAFDELASWPERFTPERRRELRRQMGVEEGGLLVVFASQPYAALCKPGAAILPSPGYDERSVAALLGQALEKIAGESSRDITLVIRPHPREDPDNFRHLTGDRVHIRVWTEGDGRELIAAADLVTGMNSVLLIEACYLGCLVVSLQPNLCLPDALPTNRLGLSRAAYSEDEVFPAIREMLLDERVRRTVTEKLTHFQPTGDAAQRVAELVCSLLRRDIISTHS